MKKKLCVVLADYYDDITELLVKGATEEILQAESKGIIKKLYGDSPHDMFLHVPGVFEIPVTISKLINKYDAFVALGCVIKGKTPHFDLISAATINAIMHLSITYKKPIGNGIITCLNKKQALERSGIYKKNKASEATKATLSVLGILKSNA